MAGWLKAPNLGSSDRNRQASLLHALLTVLLFSIALLSVVLYFLGDESRVALFLSFASFLVVVLCTWLARRGLLKAASSILVYFLWFVLTLAVYSFDGIDGTAILGQILIVFLGGLLLSERLGTFLGFMTIASNYGAMLLQLSVGLPLETADQDLMSRWTVQAVYLLIAIGLMRAATRSIGSALSASERNEQVLKDRVVELRQTQTQLEMSEQDLLRREAILKAVGLAAEKLFRGESLEESIPRMMEELGKATSADRMYIFQNRETVDGRLLARQRFEWVAEGVEPQMDHPALQALDFQEAGLARWQELLNRNVVVRGLVESFPKPERAFLETLDISSILVVPIFVANDWWGFMGFDDTKWQREWSPPEEDALRAAADILGGAVERRRAEEALNRSEARYRAILRDQVELISRYLPDGRITFTNEAFRRYFALSDEEANQANLWEMVHESDEPRLRQKVASLTIETPVLVSKSLSPRGDGVERWMEWTDRGIFDSKGKLLEVQAVGRDIHEEERLRQEIETQAMTDSLTGLLNRRAIMDHAEAEWHRAAREGGPLSLILMDVDKLKDINDSYGHLVGDRALTDIAGLLRSGMRRYDWAGRWGGDEFLMILPNTKRNEAAGVAERIRAELEAHRLDVGGGGHTDLMASLGVACEEKVAGDVKGVEALLAKADEALYQAKQKGRNQVGVL